MTQPNLKSLLNIKYPIIQAGMVWVSGGNLAAAAANTGVLGVIGAGSMAPEVLKTQLAKAQAKTTGSLAVNLPLLYSKIEEQIQISLDAGIKIFITSAGSPKKYTAMLKSKGCTVIHVCSTPELAQKCEAAGVDAVIAEGFEAGGHNGRDEITTMCLIPQCVKAINIPVIAAGGIATGEAVVAAMSLGAAGVQIGSRFAVSQESSAHKNFKDAIINAGSGDTKLVLKELVPVRLLKNKFYEQVVQLEANCAGKEKLQALLGKGRARAGMHEGKLDEGELEIGQVSALIKDNPTCQEIVDKLLNEISTCRKRLSTKLSEDFCS